MQIEIQLRTALQHAWAEAIEQTSVLCECSLKECEGPVVLIDFFKTTSDAFFAVDYQKKIADDTIRSMELQEQEVAKIVSQHPKMASGGKEMNEKFMAGMIAKERRRKGKIKNWLLIFNWKEGVFVYWMDIESNPEQISKQYSSSEKSWSYDQGYEVVLIGSSNVASIKETHSHYFGVESYEDILTSIHSQINAYRDGLSHSAYYVLQKLHSHKCWSANSVSLETLKNHYCTSIDCIQALYELRDRGYVILSDDNEKIALVSSKCEEISRLVG